jgi:hypothetical protein
MPHLILYSKPGCHLCEGLQEKIEQIQSFSFTLEMRDITTQADWFQAYQYEIPVLFWQVGDEFYPIPRLSPRSSAQQVEQMLQTHLFEILERARE